MEYILLFIGILIIVIGAEIFIDGIESTAINFKVPKMFIVLTVVAFGTSLPEFVISFQGLMGNKSDVVLSNVIGSTIVNSLLIIGASSLIKPIRVKNTTIKKELPLHLLIITIFTFLYLDKIFLFQPVNILTRIDAVILLFVFLLFLKHLITLIKNRDETNEGLEKPKFSLSKSIIHSLVGLILIIIGSNITVDYAVLVAKSLGWSEKIITMLFVVIGTSIPELIMSIVSAKKGQYDFIVGNIIGTNIFNICIVLGVPILIFGAVSSVVFSVIDMIVVILSGITMLIFARNDKVISRKEGIIMITIFLIYYMYILL